MGSRTCMNTSCGATTSPLWKKGWELKSGQIADLCIRCGLAYEKGAYCDTFHLEEAGWRECSLCNKRLHCGCSASASFLDIQDFGGVWCINCARNAGCHPVRGERTYHEVSTASNVQNTHVNELNNAIIDGGRLLTLGSYAELNEVRYLPQSLTHQADGSVDQMKPDARSPMTSVNMVQPKPSQPLASSNDMSNLVVGDMLEPRTPLNMSLRVPSESPNFSLAPPGVLEEADKNKAALFQTGQKPRHILPKPPKTNPLKGSETNRGFAANMRVARPPAEGRLRNQLLPRYWPRITDQELQQLSGDLKSTVVPLFEKVLSASDASRIGRLVLPKACAEAYFPPIHQSEGLPLKVQDVKGSEWTFQFRFWPNNNSRMYVLEGMTPCIQSMQLQAGDTVTFSRIDPGGKLVLGFRKATNAVEPQQDPQTSATNNSAASGEGFYSDGTDSPSVNGYSSLVQSFKGSKDNHLGALAEQSNIIDLENNLGQIEKNKSMVSESSLQRPVLSADKKKTRNIGPKNKRLLMNREDAIELKISWEETQDMLRPPPNMQANIVVIEGCEFEEFDDPPVFGKKTVFTNLPSGGYEQWTQCDKCMKWRKLPVDVLLPPSWTCSDNIWDVNRSSCSAPEEMDARDLNNLQRPNRDAKRRKIGESSDAGREPEPSGLDALATAATLGEDSHVSEEPSTAATTKHPRHRPGCSCIVCIQPPSGKGKHKSSCMCTVCSTVKRRFKTLMLRKQQRQEQNEAEFAAQQKKYLAAKEAQRKEGSKSSNTASSSKDNIEKETSQENHAAIEGDASKGGNIDLNSHPNRDEEMQLDTSGLSLMSLVAATTHPEIVVQQNGSASTTSLTNSGSSKQLQQENGTGEGSPAEEGESASAALEQESRNADGQKPPSES